MIIIEAEKLCFSYDGERKILDDMNFEIGVGEMIGIIGDSGSGKSTLCHVLCGIIPNLICGTISGNVSVAGKQLRDCDLKSLSGTIGFIMKNHDRQIVTSSVEDELAFGPENLCVPPEKINERIDEVLAALDIENIREIDPNKLSEGQKHLVTIGAVMTLQPDILVLDEPFGYLDNDNKKMVKGILKELQEAGRTVIIAEHDLDMLRDADKWLLLENGRVKMFDIPEKVRKHI